jgi:Na+/H+ antiporter NhaB
MERSPCSVRALPVRCPALLCFLNHYHAETTGRTLLIDLCHLINLSGQAAFLFVLTSSIAPLVHLSYGKMVYMAAPYTLVLAVSGLLGVVYLID